MRSVFTAFSLVFISIIYLLKVDTYDLYTYTLTVDYPFFFEPGFAYLVYSLSLIFEENRAVIAFIQFLLAILIFFASVRVWNSKYFTKDRNLIFLLVLIIGSIFFTLGVNNAIRQCFAGSFLILALVYTSEKKYFISLLFTFFAFMFHFSSIFLSVIMYIMWFMIIIMNKTNIQINSFILRFIALLFFTVISIISYYTLYQLADFAGYSNYFGRSIGVGGEGTRTGIVSKVVSVFFYFCLSETLIKSIAFKNNLFRFIFLLRYFFIAFLVVLAIFQENELGSRILYYYFLIELLSMICLFKLKHNLPGIVIFLFYGFALNAWNIIQI